MHTANAKNRFTKKKKFHKKTKKRNNKMLKSTDAIYNAIINNITNFSTNTDPVTMEVSTFYKKVELVTITNDFPIISRQLGNALPLLDMFNNNLEFMSAESVKGKPDEIFHKNYYCIVKAISEDTALVRVKYFDPPKKYSHLDTSMYLELMKGIVEDKSNITIVDEPYGLEDSDIMLAPNMIRMRPNTFGSFYFEVVLSGTTYGNILLQVKEIINQIESSKT